MDKQLPLQGGLTEAWTGHLLGVTGTRPTTAQRTFEPRMGGGSWGAGVTSSPHVKGQLYLLASDSGSIIHYPSLPSPSALVATSRACPGMPPLTPSPARRFLPSCHLAP